MPAIARVGWPAQAGWLERDKLTPLQVAMVERLFCDLGLAETPPGSNDSPRIRRYLARAGTEPHQPWCAAQYGACVADVGGKVPTGYASCDAWVKYAKERGLWVPRDTFRGLSIAARQAYIGGAVLYGSGDPRTTSWDATHIGGLVRADGSYTNSIEGNVTFGDFTVNGVICAMRSVDWRHVLGVMPLVPA